MARIANYKRTSRTQFSGQCKCGGAWSERVRTAHQANKSERKACKTSLTKIIKEWS